MKPSSNYSLLLKPRSNVAKLQASIINLKYLFYIFSQPFSEEMPGPSWKAGVEDLDNRFEVVRDRLDKLIDMDDKKKVNHYLQVLF